MLLMDERVEGDTTVELTVEAVLYSMWLALS